MTIGIIGKGNVGTTIGTGTNTVNTTVSLSGYQTTTMQATFIVT